MSMVAKAFVGAICLTLCASGAHTQTANKPPRKTLGMSAVEAAEVLLRDVCMASRYDGKVAADLAKHEGALEQPAKFFNGGPSDRAFRIGPIGNPVYAVDWADSTCTTRATRGDVEVLRAMAERVILARPDGFTRRRHSVENNGEVERTVYCAYRGSERLFASITTPSEAAARGTVAMSSTVYKDKGPVGLCQPTATP